VSGGWAGRVAGAPISWGVCEVPGWGYQLAPDLVLDEMRALGLAATEFGPDGFLPAGSEERLSLLAANGLRAAGGFVPVVLHDPGHDPLPDVDAAIDGFGSTDAVLVLAAATGQDGYDTRPELDAAGWRTLLANADRAARRASERGFTAALHPHVGTMIERADEVSRLLDGAQIALCLDTGHLLIGGTEPAPLARQAAGRISHVHLKDVDASLADRVTSGETTYTQAVRDGMYRPLGEGDAAIGEVVTALETAGYQGWYVLEQDTILDGPPGGPGTDNAGPPPDVRASLDYLREQLK
jgi:inosose dehydratase